MINLGTNYGGWTIPKNNTLDENSIVYGAGVGEDISFDLLLSDKYNCKIVLIDPTGRAKKHYLEIQEYYKTGNFKFSGDIQPDYEATIKDLHPDFGNFIYSNMGLWDEETELKFYKPDNEKYVSHTIIEGLFSDKYEIIKTKTIKQIMEENNHNHIDLLKLDIEGAEIKVLEKMLEDKIYPKYLCIEFDLYLKGKDTDSLTIKIISKLLKNNYKMIHNDNMNITYELQI